jgi:septal ring factor EnvC (AmiA/AmiB activator)
MTSLHPRILRGAAGAAVACALAIAFAPSAAVRAQTVDSRIDSKQKELDKIKRDIEEQRRKSKELGRQEKNVVGALSSIEKEIDLSRTFLDNLEQQEALLNEQIEDIKAQILSQSDALDAKEEALARRLRQMYKRDPHHSYEVILGSKNIQDAMRRYKFTQIVAERDARIVKEVRVHRRSLEAESAAMTESLAEMSAVRQSREEEAQRLESNKSKRETLLTSIRSQKTETGKAIARLEKAQEEIKDLIGQLQSRRTEGLPGSGEFAAMKGKLPWPVQGKVRRGFGESRHPKYGTVTFNNGIDIEAASGSPILAVASGVVEYVDWIDAYGKCIIVNHGGGYYTLYAHVSTALVTQGQKVAIGDVIAEVGDTGSLSGFECHFEVRQGKQALDPRAWLKK